MGRHTYRQTVSQPKRQTDWKTNGDREQTLIIFNIRIFADVSGPRDLSNLLMTSTKRGSHSYICVASVYTKLFYYEVAFY